MASSEICRVNDKRPEEAIDGSVYSLLDKLSNCRVITIAGVSWSMYFGTFLGG
jgi:hypothetical protein